MAQEVRYSEGKLLTIDGRAVDIDTVLGAGLATQAELDLTNTFVTRLTGAYSTYTPSIKGASVDPVIGTTNAVVVGRYKHVGRRCWGFLNITLGTEFTAGSGAWGVVLPVVPYNGVQPIGTGYLNDASDQSRVVLAAAAMIPALFSAASKAAVLLLNNSATDGFNDGNNPMGPTVPFTFAAGDGITVSFDYETASDAD